MGPKPSNKAFGVRCCRLHNIQTKRVKVDMWVCVEIEYTYGPVRSQQQPLTTRADVLVSAQPCPTLSGRPSRGTTLDSFQIPFTKHVKNPQHLLCLCLRGSDAFGQTCSFLIPSAWILSYFHLKPKSAGVTAAGSAERTITLLQPSSCDIVCHSSTARLLIWGKCDIFHTGQNRS